MEPSVSPTRCASASSIRVEAAQNRHTANHVSCKLSRQTMVNRRRDFLLMNSSIVPGCQLSPGGGAVPVPAANSYALGGRMANFRGRHPGAELLKPNGNSHIWLPASAAESCTAFRHLSKDNFDPVHSRGRRRPQAEPRASRSLASPGSSSCPAAYRPRRKNPVSLADLVPLPRRARERPHWSMNPSSVFAPPLPTRAELDYA